ncbi:MAG TPA: DnaA regulatory inactivator Hda [Burkholderiales bacterium]|jgi:DnaA family protein|nr:DnaA regulatory inactivator Hda [Burkholderiales bacterium]
MVAPQQLLLGLADAPLPTLQNFVTGGNGAVLAALRAFGNDAGARALYLWGGQGSGRSHLLRAWAAARGAAYADARAQPELAGIESGPALAVDNCEALNGTGQIALFNLYNQARASDSPAYLLVSGPLPPPQLKLRDDLQSRLAWGLSLEVAALTDAEKLAALQAHAQARGMRLADEVTAYMLTHVRRDMPTLMRIVEALDTASLTAKRPVTLPLLRELLNETQSLPL